MVLRAISAVDHASLVVPCQEGIRGSISGGMMDREEAQRLMADKLADYEKLSYAELVAMIGNEEYFQVKGPSGTEYQIEIQFTWDGKQDGDVRVSAAIDDGSFRGAFRPVCDDLIVSPHGPPLGDT